MFCIKQIQNRSYTIVSIPKKIIRLSSARNHLKRIIRGMIQNENAKRTQKRTFSIFIKMKPEDEESLLKFIKSSIYGD